MLLNFQEEEYKKFLFHANLNNLDFETAIRNESIQLCFIGKKVNIRY